MRCKPTMMGINTTKRRKLTVDFKIVGRYTGVLFAGFIENKNNSKAKGLVHSNSFTGGSGGLVVVERPWLDVLQHFGGVFDRRKFGT